MLIDRICPCCENTFKVAASRLKHGRGKFCSPACQYADIRTRPRDSREKRSCLCCGGDFFILKSLLSKGRGMGKYCSRACRDQHWYGENTSNWSGRDTSHHYGKEWQRQRRLRLEMDNYECQQCGSTDDLEVHHWEPYRLSFNNSTDNLVTLCSECHVDKHREYEAEDWILEAEVAFYGMDDKRVQRRLLRCIAENSSPIKKAQKATKPRKTAPKLPAGIKLPSKATAHATLH